MKLQEKMDAYKKGMLEKAPKEALEIMHRATEAVKNSGMLENTVKVGEKAPAFRLENTSGGVISLDSLLSKGPLVLGFYRGKWWPYCNLELDALGKAANEFSALGASLVMISPQAVKFNRAMQEEKNLSFEILSDPGNKTAESYGIKYQMPDDLINVYSQFGLNIPEHNGDDSWTLPLPARLIIGQDGIIRDAEIGGDYTVRPEPEDTLEKLKTLKT